MDQPRRKILLLLIILMLAAPSRPRAGSRPPASKGFTLLLSNDDGYDAPGLKALIRALQPVGDIFVAAPADNQSGKGHSISVGSPIYANPKKQPNGETWYAIEAPPATCVRLALEALMRKPPDVVISGINRGENLGLVVYYSGTVGGAREAAMSGLPAIAVSMQGDNASDYSAAAAYVRTLLEQLRATHMLKPGFFLNVNVPAGQPKGVRVTRLSMKMGQEMFERRSDSSGRPYFWQTWRRPREDEEGTDVWAFVRGYITLTPLTLDTTAPRGMNALRSLELESAVTAAAP